MGDLNHSLAQSVVLRAKVKQGEDVLSGKTITTDEETYTINKLLGCGGVGRVYDATRHSDEKEVALKFMLDPLMEATETDFPRRLKQFKTEFESGHDISEHRHILAASELHQAAELDGARTAPFLEYELVGRELKPELIRNHDEALELMRKVGLAVDFAHKKGVVHGDLKPQNILLDEDGEPLVTDFGMAKDLEAIAQSVSIQIERTSDGGRIQGTWDYIPPEVLSGKDVSESTDVYALGVILYELLTKGQKPRIRIREKLIHHHGVDAAIATFVEQTMDDEESRPKTMMEWLRRLDQVTGNTTVELEQELKETGLDYLKEKIRRNATALKIGIGKKYDAIKEFDEDYYKALVSAFNITAQVTKGKETIYGLSIALPTDQPYINMPFPEIDILLERQEEEGLIKNKNKRIDDLRRGQTVIKRTYYSVQYNNDERAALSLLEVIHECKRMADNRELDVQREKRERQTLARTKYHHVQEPEGLSLTVPALSQLIERLIGLEHTIEGKIEFNQNSNLRGEIIVNIGDDEISSRVYRFESIRGNKGVLMHVKIEAGIKDGYDPVRYRVDVTFPTAGKYRNIRYEQFKNALEKYEDKASSRINGMTSFLMRIPKEDESQEDTLVEMIEDLARVMRQYDGPDFAVPGNPQFDNRFKVRSKDLESEGKKRTLKEKVLDWIYDIFDKQRYTTIKGEDLEIRLTDHPDIYPLKIKTLDKEQFTEEGITVRELLDRLYESRDAQRTEIWPGYRAYMEYLQEMPKNARVSVARGEGSYRIYITTGLTEQADMAGIKDTEERLLAKAQRPALLEHE